MNIRETLYYLDVLERKRAKRIKALERRDASDEAAKYIKLARNAVSRYGYVTHGLKLWVRIRIPLVY